MGYGSSHNRIALAVGAAELQPHDDTLFGGAFAHWPMVDDGVEVITGGAGFDATFAGTGEYLRLGDATRVPQGKQAFVDNTDFRVPSCNTAFRSLHGAVTVACWVMYLEAPVANGSVVGCRLSGGGSTYNFPWELGIDSATQKFRSVWQSGSKVTHVLSATDPIVLGEWQHACFTRNAAGTDSTIYIGGAFDVTVGGLTAPAGGTNASEIQLMNSGAGQNSRGPLLSPIIFDQELSAGQVQQLYESTLVS